MPLRSGLRQILFLLYSEDLVRLIRSLGLLPHLFADDTQIYGSCRPDATDDLQCRVADWMKSKHLQLNTTKMEVTWYTSARRQHQLPTSPLLIGNDLVTSVSSVSDLGIHLDTDLTRAV